MSARLLLSSQSTHVPFEIVADRVCIMFKMVHSMFVSCSIHWHCDTCIAPKPALDNMFDKLMCKSLFVMMEDVKRGARAAYVKIDVVKQLSVE